MHLWREVKEKLVQLSTHSDECAAIIRSSMVDTPRKAKLKKN
jgi:hypothetical protein